MYVIKAVVGIITMIRVITIVVIVIILDLCVDSVPFVIQATTMITKV